MKNKSDEEDEQLRRENEYRQKIIESFFKYGKLVSIPAQRKKKRVCLEEIAKSFETGKEYDEKKVNDIIIEFHEDYCTIRRDMISEGIMKRNGTIYTRVQ